MKRLIFLLSSLLLCSLLQAQSSISGTITGAAGEPLPGAFIRLMNTPFQTLSDNHGNFLINAAEGSDYAIQVATSVSVTLCST